MCDTISAGPEGVLHILGREQPDHLTGTLM